MIKGEPTTPTKYETEFEPTLIFQFQINSVMTDRSLPCSFASGPFAVLVC